ncbi:MAG: DUF4388 domain-containing protein [Candidatus Obscuribacterales bacterium]|nr:DUF4388 domain-containing protein [Candidatus Obscuribacterales bacterium]
MNGNLSVDVVFEGALSKSWGMKDVLKAILDIPNAPFGVLRVSSPNKGIQGRILIAESRHIVGAALSELELDAYDALRKMLAVTEGNFAFLDLSSHEQAEFDQSLFINIEALIEMMPQLPEHSSAIFDQKALLDKVFGQEAAIASVSVVALETYPDKIPLEQARSLEFPNVSARARGRRSPAAVAAGSKSNTAPITQWNIVEPLFNNPQAMHAESTSMNMIPDYVQTPEEQRSSMNRLRAMPESTNNSNSWERAVKDQTPLKWILSALGLSAFLCLLAPLNIDAGASKISTESAAHYLTRK